MAVRTQHLQVLYDLSTATSRVESPALEPSSSTCSSQHIPSVLRYASRAENSSCTEDSSPKALICSAPPFLQLPHFRGPNPPGLFNVHHLYEETSAQQCLGSGQVAMQQAWPCCLQ